jgi:ABC-type transport system involved in multi-copper enzyme maturation permease subunit
MIRTFAWLTLHEALRRRLLQALFGLSLVAVLLTAWGYQQLTRLPPGRNGPLTTDQVQLIASQVLILVMFMFSFVLALAAVFAAAPSIAGELESGEALAVMARPIRRSSLVLGKWLGLTVVVVGYAIVASTLEFGAAFMATGYVPPHPIEALLYLAAQAIVLLTLALLLSTRTSSVVAGVVSMLLFGLAWLAGVIGGIGTAFGDPVISRAGIAGQILLPSDGLWRGALFSLEPPLVLIGGAAAGPQFAAFPFFAPAPPPLLYLAWCVVWVAGGLALAVWGFARRDL